MSLKKDERQTLEFWSRSENLEIIKGWRRSGLTLEDVASQIRVTKQTLLNWRHRNDYFKEALSMTVEEATAQIENALFKSAEGSFYNEIQKEYKYEHGQKILVGEKHITRYVPPVPTSIIFYLSNRRPDLWQRYNKEIGKGIEKRGESGIIEIAKVVEDENKERK